MRLIPDRFVLALLGAVALASSLPVRGAAALTADHVTDAAIALLFFLHGARLSREAIAAGALHWRLHGLVFAATFVMFPLLGLALRPLLAPLVTPPLYVGVLFLCCLPATVQSAIALTSLARGNVPAAVCSASASSLIGIVLTPFLAGVLIAPGGAAATSFDGLGKIVGQLLLPFVAGHLLRPWVGAFVGRHRAWLKRVDQGAILLVVYTAFSEAIVQGLWATLPPRALGGLLLVCAVILAASLAITTLAARRLGFSREDEITIVFCGSKKSLASGVPMAKVLFAGAAIGPIVLPLMLFHQLQLMVCAVLAQRYARRADDAPAPATRVA